MYETGCFLAFRRVTFWMNVSLAVNIFLLAVKIYAFIASKSKAILASAADSLVDIASQLVIAYAEYKVSMPYNVNVSFHSQAPIFNRAWLYSPIHSPSTQ